MRRNPYELSHCSDVFVGVDVVHEGVEERRSQMVDADQEYLEEELKFTFQA